MPIETLDDILEDLANQADVYGAEIRNAWISEVRRRIELAIKTAEEGRNHSPRRIYDQPSTI